MHPPRRIRTLFRVTTLFIHLSRAVSSLPNVSVINTTNAGVSYMPVEDESWNLWNPQPGHMDGWDTFKWSNEPGANVTITCTCSTIDFWYPKWPFPFHVNITIGGDMVKSLDLRDDVQDAETNITSPTSKSAKLWTYPANNNSTQNTMPQLYTISISSGQPTRPGYVVFDKLWCNTPEPESANGTIPAPVLPNMTTTSVLSSMATITSTTATTSSTTAPSAIKAINSPRGVSTSLIVGATLGALVLLCLILLISYCLYRRRKKQTPSAMYRQPQSISFVRVQHSNYDSIPLSEPNWLPTTVTPLIPRSIPSTLPVLLRNQEAADPSNRYSSTLNSRRNSTASSSKTLYVINAASSDPTYVKDMYTSDLVEVEPDSRPDTGDWTPVDTPTNLNYSDEISSISSNRASWVRHSQ